jgi:pimeloyl-ACP methyl ester carboxylesterase
MSTGGGASRATAGRGGRRVGLGRSGLVGAATGLLAAGAAAGAAVGGLAVEKYLVGRRRQRDIELVERLGSRRGEPYVVKTRDGIELYAEVDEPADPRAAPLTVVFCHGYALNLDCWHFQRAALQGIGRMVFYDHRSHGRSGRSPRELCNVDQLGQDLAQVIQDLAPEGPLVLVGHSMGGMTVLALADQRPDIFADRVVGTALLASSAGGLDRVTLGVPGPVGRLVHRLTPALVAALARVPDLVEHSRKAGSDVGQGDLITPVEHSREIAARHPAADYIELSEAGHMFLIEYPEVVNAALRELITRAGDAAEAMSS